MRKFSSKDVASHYAETKARAWCSRAAVVFVPSLSRLPEYDGWAIEMYQRGECGETFVGYV